MLILFFSLAISGFSSEEASLDSLDYYLSKQSEFDRIKEERIDRIKEEINRTSLDPDVSYSLYVTLYEEYSSYIYDSAYVYVEKLLDISRALNDKDKIISSTIKLGFCYLSSGLFKECFDILSSLNVGNCSTQTQIDYFTIKSRLYYDLADYNNRPEFRLSYDRKGNEIIDSTIALLPELSARYWLVIGLKEMKSDNYHAALDAYSKMINTHDYSEHDFAIATSSIAYLLRLQGKSEEAKLYLIQAAIADIKSSTKEAVALRNLADILYKEGDLTHSVEYIRRALDDAYFYNARHRQLEIGYILPIIEGERLNVIENQKNKISNFLLFISILLGTLIVAFLIIWMQLRRLNQAKQIIQKSNENLMEANKIKDEYIGYFFSLHSEFIEKLESFQKFVKRKVAAKQYEDLPNIPKDLDAHKEREALYSRFDRIFLKLFPNFVMEFNHLLKPDEHIQLKKGELLNTDLRIYALIRLGINDNEKIAQFLDYSVNTIYTYKTKIKNKALYSSEEFKKRVMEIKSI
ncbi:MAG: tetratricopeptide repeat protein [Dysgonamonadaceae bacterium]|jgi:tetratricopeptide (TPR) repeat protein|nr:tetratricopeptide repeat protein [Dysgonamonadaceae bacterium]